MKFFSLIINTMYKKSNFLLFCLPFKIAEIALTAPKQPHTANPWWLLSVRFKYKPDYKPCDLTKPILTKPNQT